MMSVALAASPQITIRYIPSGALMYKACGGRAGACMIGGPTVKPWRCLIYLPSDQPYYIDCFYRHEMEHCYRGRTHTKPYRCH